MAKALMGHVGFALDVRASAEMQRLRERLRLLETENEQLRAANTSLQDELHDLRLHQEVLALSADRDVDVESTATPALT